MDDNQDEESKQPKKPDNFGKYYLWTMAFIFAALIYDNFTNDRPKVNWDRLEADSRRTSRAIIEREELQRQMHGDAPLTDDEISGISSQSVLRAYRHQKQ